MPSSVLGGTTLRICGAELQAEARVGLPAAVGADHLAGRDRRAFADHGRRLALVRELDPEHAEAAVGIVEHHPLDQAGEGLRRRLRGGEDERLGGGRRPVMADAAAWRAEPEPAGRV